MDGLIIKGLLSTEPLKLYLKISNSRQHFLLTFSINSSL